MTTTIQRPGDAMGQIFWHAPTAPIPVNTAVVVGDRECVVVSRDGAMLGVIPPGSHWMHPQPFPFVGPCIDPQGNVHVELCFVSTAEISGIQVGGSLGDVYDKGLGVACSPRAFFDFSLKVTNPTQLVQNVMGQGIDADALVGWVKTKVLNRAKEVLAATVAAGTSVMNPKIAGAFSRELTTTDLSSTSLVVTRVGDVTMNFSEDDLKALKGASAAKVRQRIAEHQAQAAAPPPQQQVQVRCTRCGLDHTGGRFCTSCGAPLA